MRERERPQRGWAGAARGGLALVLCAAWLHAALPAAAAAPSAGAEPAGVCALPATNPDPATPWAQQRLAPERAWPLTRGAATVVAIVDTGVSAAAPALAGAVLPGQDVRSGGSADADCSGHGTFVAGLLAAQPVAGSGLVGVAPAVQLLPVRVTDNPDHVDPDALAGGIRAAVDAGARVAAVSVSAPAGSPALLAAVSEAWRHDVLVVAPAEHAAGSGDQLGADPDPPAYPAALPGVLAVAAIGPDGAATADTSPASKPDLAAPGAALTSIAPTGPGNLTASGHGLAVAFVAGAAALVRTYHPTLTATEVSHRLETTADHPSGPALRPLLGEGIVDPTAAVAAVLPEESGHLAAPKLPSRPLRVPVTVPTDPGPAHVALTAGAGAAAAIVLGCLLARLVERGRRRGWRPAGADPAAGADPPA